MPDKLERFNETVNDIGLFDRDNWSALWILLKQKPELAKSNPEIKQAIIDLENIFFSNLENYLADETVIDTLEVFYILHRRKIHLLSQSRFSIIVKKMIMMLKNTDLHKAYKLAMNFPDDYLCQTIIRDYENFLPRKISHSQSRNIQILENKNINLIDGRRGLFKSAQEKEFLTLFVKYVHNLLFIPMWL